LLPPDPDNSNSIGLRTNDDDRIMPSRDGRPSVDETPEGFGKDHLLAALRREHGPEPRYDIAPELLKHKARSAATPRLLLVH
jgi:hypothetical protein